jgi:prepilin-type processing-associated H-X9-DG protein
MCFDGNGRGLVRPGREGSTWSPIESDRMDAGRARAPAGITWGLAPILLDSCEDRGEALDADTEDLVAVYLEVVAANATPVSSGSQVLEGNQCLVFYLGGIQTSRQPHSGAVNVLMGDGSVRVAKNLDEIAAQLSRTPISGGMIILGPASQTGYVTTRWQLTSGSKQVPSLGLTSTGGQVVLIGLLLPAVQAAREAARTKTRSVAIQQLRSAVGLSGHVFVIGSQGELLTL